MQPYDVRTLSSSRRSGTLATVQKEFVVDHFTEQPIPPGDYDCCESGCEPCVWDVYQAEMSLWRAAEAKRKAAEAAENKQPINPPETAPTS